MKILKPAVTTILFLGFLTSVLVSSGCAAGNSDPVVDRSTPSRKLENLERQAGPKKAVTIYQFKSTVDEVSAFSATDMFTTALVKSRTFRVLERQRLSESVLAERELNASGMTTGRASETLLTGADYIFEGVITEANPDAARSGIGGTIKGLGIETSGETGEIGLDVRIIDAKTGEVIDAVNVRKKVKTSGFSAKGFGSFLQGMTGTNLGGVDASVSHDSREGIDKALRACIDEAVFQIARRFGR